MAPINTTPKALYDGNSSPRLTATDGRFQPRQIESRPPQGTTIEIPAMETPGVEDAASGDDDTASQVPVYSGSSIVVTLRLADQARLQNQPSHVDGRQSIRADEIARLQDSDRSELRAIPFSTQPRRSRSMRVRKGENVKRRRSYIAKLRANLKRENAEHFTPPVPEYERASFLENRFNERAEAKESARLFASTERARLNVIPNKIIVGNTPNPAPRINKPGLPNIANMQWSVAPDGTVINTTLTEMDALFFGGLPVHG